MKLIKNLIAFWLIPFISCGQPGHPVSSNKSFFNEKDYIEIKRGEDDGYPYVIILANKLDTNYKLKINYIWDSTYGGNSFVKTFYYKNVPNGPFIGYVDGQLSRKGTYNNGQTNGERLTYSNGVLIKRAFFDNGIKVGKWEEYEEGGKLIRITVYDNKGKVIKDEEFK